MVFINRLIKISSATSPSLGRTRETKHLAMMADQVHPSTQNIRTLPLQKFSMTRASNVVLIPGLVACNVSRNLDSTRRSRWIPRDFMHGHMLPSDYVAIERWSSRTTVSVSAGIS